MPLPLPNLDNRRWADLVEEGRALIPRYAPAWTDHNIHDPGITLMELFAWLADGDIFRLNQVPERHIRKFLALIGCTPRPPQAARTLLSFAPAANNMDLPAGIIFETAGQYREPVQFRTLQGLTIVNTALVTIQVDSGGGPIDQTRLLRAGLPFYPFGQDPRPGAMLYLGFDTALPDGKPVTLGLRFTGTRSSYTERQRIIDEARRHAIAMRHPRPWWPCKGAETIDYEPLILPPHHAVDIEWEFCDASGIWTRLCGEKGQVIDDTRAFMLDGTVRLVLPGPMSTTQVGQLHRELFYLRCRLSQCSQYDTAPQIADLFLNAADAVQAIPAWQKFTIAPGAQLNGIPPSVYDMTGINPALDTEQRITQLDFLPAGNPGVPDIRLLQFHAPVGNKPGSVVYELVLLGNGTGMPGQRLTFPDAPVLAESVSLHTFDKDGWHVWTRRDDLDASQRTDTHFMLDAMTAEIVFGDGERGRIPAPSAAIFATYEMTGAERGNVPANSITHCADIPRNVALLGDPVRAQLSQITTNRAAAIQGAPTESVMHAIGRAVEILWAHERLQHLAEQYDSETLDQAPGSIVRSLQAPTRAVTLLDIERLALDVPGTHVRRARAWSKMHPHYQCIEAVGVVTLVVVPELPARRPQPSQGLLTAVRCYLERRRIVTTRIVVVGPEYLEVRVHAAVQGQPGFNRQQLRELIKKELDRFLDPLRGGPDGYGWPFGRDVYRNEILQTIANVPGVGCVSELTLTGDRTGPECGNLCVKPTWLVTPGIHQIVVL